MGQEIKLYTKAELSKAKTTILNEAQLDHLLAKTPDKHIYKRPAKGGGEWSYVTGMYVKKKLNFMFGWNWDFTVVNFDVNIQARQVIVHGRLTVRSNGQEIKKDQFGRQDIKFKKGTENPLDLGNDIKGATTDALKKCASELGIASDVYAPEEFKEVRVSQEPIKSEIDQKRQAVIETLDQYQGEDKEEIQKKCQVAKQNGTESVEFYNEILNQIGHAS